MSSGAPLTRLRRTTDRMADRVLRLGVIGLSRGFDLTRPTLLADPRVRVVAAADPRPEARAAFQAEFDAPAYEFAELCADRDVEVVYIASPHETHADLTRLAAERGKHILVEKPMALSLAECRAMTAAARAAGVRLLVGPSHGFDPPVVAAGNLIASGEFGRPRMITATTFTDFLYRPRRLAELDTAPGRRRGLQPGGAPGGRRAASGRCAGAERPRHDRPLGPRATDRGRLSGLPGVRWRRVGGAHLFRLRPLRHRRPDGLGRRDRRGQGSRGLRRRPPTAGRRARGATQDDAGVRRRRSGRRPAGRPRALRLRGGRLRARRPAAHGDRRRGVRGRTCGAPSTCPSIRPPATG